MSASQRSTLTYQLPKGYKQTEVGVIPEEWQVLSLSEITEPQRPISYGIVQTGPNIANGIRCIRVLDINEGRINKAELITTSRQISDAYRRTILKSGDLVMPLRGKVGDVGLVDEELEGANLTRGVALVAIRAGWSHVFCQQVISSSATRKRLEQTMNGSALQEIPIASLRAFKIQAPQSLNEQRTIAETLSDVDALLGALDRLIAKKRDLKQAAMQQLLTGQTRLPGFAPANPRFQQTDVGMIPDDWQLTRIGDVASVSAGGTPSRTVARYWKGGVPWITTSQVDFNIVTQADQFISEDGLKNSPAKLLPPGTLLMALYGQGKTRGKVATLGISATTNQACAAISLGGDVSRDFVFRYLISQYDFIRNLSNTGNQENLNGVIVKSIPLPLPPTVAEQTAIAAVLSDMDEELTALELRRAKTRALKQGMMQELLTGRTRLVPANVIERHTEAKVQIS